MTQYLKNGLITLAKESKSTNRLFRINQSIYLYKGKFYKSDVFNIKYVVEKCKPSTTYLDKDTIYEAQEIEPTENNKRIYNF